MRIIVCMKQVIDLAQLRFKSDGRTPVLEGLPLRLGAFEKNALEEAVQIKERLGAVEVIVLSAGSAKLKESIKEALAMGADRALLVIDPAAEAADAAGTARVLAAAIHKLTDWDVCLLGEGSDDEYTGQVPSRLAALLGVPQITNVRALEVAETGRVRATRDLEAQLEVVACDPPVLISVTSELNTPRLPPLTAILKAGRKPVEAWTLADLGLSADQVAGAATQVETLSSLAPAQARKKVIFEGALDEQVEVLLRSLEHEGVLT